MVSGCWSILVTQKENTDVQLREGYLSNQVVDRISTAEERNGRLL